MRKTTHKKNTIEHKVSVKFEHYGMLQEIAKEQKTSVLQLLRGFVIEKMKNENCLSLDYKDSLKKGGDNYSKIMERAKTVEERARIHQTYIQCAQNARDHILK